MKASTEATDLDTLILQAEHAVMQRDRALRREVDALAQALREHTGRLTVIGVGAVSALMLVAWLLSRSRDEPAPPR